MSEYVDIAVRAYTEIVSAEEPASRSRARQQPLNWRPKHVLVFDTETTTDCTQRLLLGCYRFYEATWSAAGPKLQCLDEGFFYADELPDTDPGGFEALRDYVSSHEPPVDPALSGWRTAIGLRLMSRSEFVERFDKAARKGRATVVGFNLPFDLSRIAVACTDARGGRFAGGFSFVLSEYTDANGTRRPNPHRAGIAIKTIDSKRSLIGLTAPLETDPIDRIPEGATNGKPKRGYAFRGHFLDLRTLTFALTDRGHTLESACDTFSVPYTKRSVDHGRITTEYVTYCREDVQATAQLYTAAIREYVRHPIELQPTKAYSPASVGKSYLRAMGVRPPLDRQPDFSRDVLGYAMAAYYGGRAECRIRRVPIPVVYCDFLAMYSTVCALLGLWRLLTSSSVRVVEHNPAQLHARLNNLTPEQLLDQVSWPGLVGLAEIAPAGDVLPVRGRYDGRNFGIGINPLHTREPMWYALPDLHASALIGRAPTILRHITFEPGRKARTLQPVRLRGKVEIDPGRDDFIKTLVEQRKTLGQQPGLNARERERLDRFLKVLGNSTNYGIYAEMNRQEQPGNKRTEVAVHGVDQFTSKTATPEVAGGYFFSPYACVIASGARMMLALLERLVTDLGGTYAFCDTDSMAIVSTQGGELIPCPGRPHLLDGKPAIRELSWKQTDQIVKQFERLNPYNRDAIAGSVLETETQNFDPNTGKRRQLYCQAISAKRYVLYNTDQDGNTTVRTDVWDDPDDPDPDAQSVSIEELRKRSEHGLGHLLNPTNPDDESRDWITTAWEDETRRLLGIPTGPEPNWLDRPALTRTTISTPNLRKAFTTLNKQRAYPEQIKPFNFLLVAHVAPFGHPTGANPERFVLVAPYNPDARQWKKLRWTNPYQPATNYRITTIGQPTDRVVRVKTYRDVLTEYRTHPEPKSLGPDGEPCDRDTIGLLARRRVRATTITHIGKEANRLEDRGAGLVHDPTEVSNDYGNPAGDPFDQLVAAVLREITVSAIANTTGLSERTVKRARSGTTSASRATRAALTEFAADHARSRLQAAGVSAPRQSLTAIAVYLDRPEAAHRICAGCGAELTGRQTRWCSEPCRRRGR